MYFLRVPKTLIKAISKSCNFKDGLIDQSFSVAFFGSEAVSKVFNSKYSITLII